MGCVVLRHTPCLLSAGQLVQDGCELRWGPAGCYLVKPDGVLIPLDVAGGVPLLNSGDMRGAHGKGTTEQAAAAAAVEGVAERHRQHGDYPWREDCAVCNAVAPRSAQHRRRLPHAGVLAVDVA